MLVVNCVCVHCIRSLQEIGHYRLGGKSALTVQNTILAELRNTATQVGSDGTGYDPERI